MDKDYTPNGDCKIPQAHRRSKAWPLILAIVFGGEVMYAPCQSETHEQVSEIGHYSGRQSESDTTPSRSTFDIVLEHVALPAATSPPDNVFPGAPDKVVLGYPDCDYDRRCYCGHRFSYRLQAAEHADTPALVKKLAELTQLPMFGCYETGEDLRGRRQKRCRFVRKVQLVADERTFDGISIPTDLGPTVTAWIESTVRVDQKQLPIEEASSVSMPILLNSGDNTYSVMEDLKGTESDCLLEVSFSGKVFDFFSCKQDLTCISKNVETFRSSLKAELSNDPLDAIEVKDEPIPPGEMWMRNQYKPSRILGAPYFELTTYVLKLWFAGVGKGPSSTEPNVNMHSLYMNTAQSITRSVGVRGRYEEPTQEELAAYKSAMNAAIARALAKACHDIHGQLTDSVCHY